MDKQNLNLIGIKLEPEELIIQEEPGDTVEELMTQEHHESVEEGETLNISSDSHCFVNSQVEIEVSEDVITDKMKIKSEEIVGNEHQELQEACSLTCDWKIDQQPKYKGKSCLQPQGSGIQFKCELCLKAFSMKRYPKQHIMYVHGERKSFNCSENISHVRATSKDTG